jgi:hypothetical protein
MKLDEVFRIHIAQGWSCNSECLPNMCEALGLMHTHTHTHTHTKNSNRLEDKTHLFLLRPGIPQIHASAEPSLAGIGYCVTPELVSTMLPYKRAVLDPDLQLEPKSNSFTFIYLSNTSIILSMCDYFLFSRH